MVEKIISKSGSFDGWSFKTWFVGNWKTLKEIAKVGVPFVLTFLATQDPYLLVLFTSLGKLALDTGEYFFSVYTK